MKFYYKFCSFLIFIFDKVIPKKKNYWGFSTHHIKSDQFVENARALFEEVKKDASFKKIIFSREGVYDFEIDGAVNYEVLSLKSLKGVIALMKCQVLFVTHSISMDYSFRFGNSDFSVNKLNLSNRHVINLWHGIPLKKLYALWNTKVKSRLDRVGYRNVERKGYKGLISSSRIDSYAMATMFHPLEYSRVWTTGLPRNDFLLMSKKELPNYFKEQLNRLEEIKKDKKLILYAPTYRQTKVDSSSKYYQFSSEEIDNLKNVLKKHNAIFGFRMHYFRNDENLFNVEDFIDNELIFDLGHSEFSEIAVTIRGANMVISDYSSVFVESMYVNKPLISFAYDLEHYEAHQDGLLYDYNLVFPGKVVKSFVELIRSIDEEMENPDIVNSEGYQFSKKFFFENIDKLNSRRVVDKIKDSL
ncbi:MAG: CDP-glycerol glycerophosphotransferase family protein [Balneola sp.]